MKTHVRNFLLHDTKYRKKKEKINFKMTFFDTLVKGCDSNLEVNFSNFKSCYKSNKYLALYKMY